jgi:hypothetical protein
MRLDVRAVASHRALVAGLCATAVTALVACGGGSSSPTVTPTAVPTPAATATPVAESPGVCNPTPPPLYGVKVKIHDDSGFRKILDSRPQVVNTTTSPSYCEQVEQGNGPFCFPRTEGGDLQMFACDSLAMGRALDTGRWGPTWYYNGKPCDAVGDTTPGCRNHPDNQFLVIAKGPGEYAACANPNVPIAGNRCGIFIVP